MNDHNAEGLVVTCIDFRLQEAINRWIAQNFQPKAYDRVALAGGVKSLDTVLGQIDIAVRLHNIKKVVLINHDDCGAYGQENFPDTQTEHLRHTEDLRNAKAKIKEKHPDLEVETFYLHLDGFFEPIS
ncbi:MAG: hypothetical protein Q8P92_03555 [Candidatus Daviesbacteria bacterium]|nr:hypothetical protein [Candidatus Daviesbacteria bacterium]